MWGFELRKPAWEPPPGVEARLSTRAGGVSDGRYGSCNLAEHVGDDAGAVGENRMRFAAALPGEPAVAWIRQEHGAEVLEAAAKLTGQEEPACDGIWTARPGQACVVLTADCVPLLLAAADGSQVAAVHAGWRGLAAGIVAKACAAFGGKEIAAYIGPCISAANYVVKEDVHERLRAAGGEDGLRRDDAGWHADLTAIARGQLRAAGVERIAVEGVCTFGTPRDFYSARRDGQASGRFATAVWRTA
ncbi:MAG: peptidoglycan editing factor PgeF [Betaproteobacteria bacterium AqS2]|uniref:Purine nucleoside phosphorylase n=1 Tax=Candidatus Amphirhobacter heronislandensis TaxID=1732024 RepID=A0A930UF46_9GAMM|nr:peptidoglycan editing factor PgeF [Betaproteobacteria bacterium AqS2]